MPQGNRCRLESGATLPARADVDADDEFTVALHDIEAVLAKRQGKLVFALVLKLWWHFAQVEKGRVVAQFANVNSG